MTRRRSPAPRPAQVAITTRSRPPRMIRAAPIETAPAGSGANVRTVPVVPHNAAASSTSAAPAAPAALDETGRDAGEDARAPADEDERRSEEVLGIRRDTRTLLEPNRADGSGSGAQTIIARRASSGEEGRPRRPGQEAGGGVTVCRYLMARW